jgi:hypothetical protein
MPESDEISVLKVDMKVIVPQYMFRTRFAPTEYVRVFAFVLLPICAQYELQT